ncbi:MAG: L,D-transpeptidase [Gammaproteobacteria bacterium]|jgi:hypothetical protein
MKKFIIILSGILIGLVACTINVQARNQSKPISKYYGIGLCDKPGYKCIRISRGTTWERRFPDPRERDIVQRLNRSDTYLYSGRKIVVPEDLQNTSLKDITPFPLQIKSPNEKLMIVDQNLLAVAAYDPNGHLVFWGPISSGKNYCPDAGRACRTTTGIYFVFHKKGPECRSNVYPVGRGGSHMPFCMFFYKGYALHGSKEVYGFRDSHGCIRMFTRDAKWLNENFVGVAHRDGSMGTKIVVQKLKDEPH